MGPGRRREMVNRGHPALSAVREWSRLGITRSGSYFQRQGTSEEDFRRQDIE